MLALLPTPRRGGNVPVVPRLRQATGKRLPAHSPRKPSCRARQPSNYANTALKGDQILYRSSSLLFFIVKYFYTTGKKMK